MNLRNQTFRFRRSLTRHMQFQKNPPLQCRYCPFMSCTTLGLIIHKKKLHTRKQNINNEELVFMDESEILAVLL